MLGGKRCHIESHWILMMMTMLIIQLTCDLHFFHLQVFSKSTMTTQFSIQFIVLLLLGKKNQEDLMTNEIFQPPSKHFLGPKK